MFVCLYVPVWCRAEITRIFDWESMLCPGAALQMWTGSGAAPASFIFDLHFLSELPETYRNVL